MKTTAWGSAKHREVSAAPRKANIFLHELFVFQFSEGATVVVLAGHRNNQQTSLARLLFVFSIVRNFYFFDVTKNDFSFSGLLYPPPPKKNAHLSSTCLHSRMWALKAIVYFWTPMIIFNFSFSQKDSYLLWNRSRMRSMGLPFHISAQAARQSSSITFFFPPACHSEPCTTLAALPKGNVASHSGLNVHKNKLAWPIQFAKRCVQPASK